MTEKSGRERQRGRVQKFLRKVGHTKEIANMADAKTLNSQGALPDWSALPHLSCAVRFFIFTTGCLPSFAAHCDDISMIFWD